MHIVRALGLALLVAALAGAWGTFAAEAAAPGRNDRLALIIGNADYPNAPLRNPVNDARDLAAALAASGFEVIRLENADLRQLRTAVREFGDRLKRQGGVGLFYFAGHGMQLNGRNFLIPVGARIEREDEVEFESLDANLVLEKLDSAGNRFNIVILDACRNNPFARRFRSGSQGLAQMDAPTGTVIAFATAPGSVASDGPGRNGLYTHHLVEQVARPGLKLEDVFKQVRAAVRQESNGQQVPWESTSLEGDFYFRPVDTAAVDAARRKEEQARLEEMVRAAVAQERERIRREMAETRPDQEPKGRPPAPSVPSAADSPSPPRVIGDRADGPVAAPRFAVGDAWEFVSVTSGASGRAEATTAIDRWTVVSVTAGRLGLAHARLDRPGGAPLDPPQQYQVLPTLATMFEGRNAFDGRRKFLSFPLEAGARWTYSYEWSATSGSGRFRDDFECVAAGWEQVTVPAGTFWALRIDERGWSTNVSSGPAVGTRSPARVDRTLWYSPGVKYVVKSEFRRSNPSLPTDPLTGNSITTRQLVRFSVAPEARAGYSGARTQ